MPKLFLLLVIRCECEDAHHDMGSVVAKDCIAVFCYLPLKVEYMNFSK